MDAAETVVRESGVGALRLDSVADAVGLHRSSVYRYFGSKQELITAVVVQETLRIGRRVIDQLGASATPEQLIVETRTALEAPMKQLRSKYSLGRIDMFAVSCSPSLRDPWSRS